MEIKELYEIYKAHPVVTTDSRNCPEGSIFFALKGETFDGNKFAMQALEKGCAYAVVDDSSFLTSHSSLIFVDNVLDTLQQLARYHRQQMDIPFVGITGTNGKTTTKELVATVLSKKYRVHYTQGNFNNHIGVPLTLLSIKPDCEIAVIEMGANHPGEIKTLANIALPTCGLITNVGKAHLEGFGSLEGVINTKKELYDNLAERGGHVFVNAANSLLMNVLNAESYTTYSSNVEVSADVDGRLLRCAPYVEFEWNNKHIATHFVGAYNLDNMLAAITVGLHFGVEEKDICDAISNYVPANNRSQLTKTERNTLIVDAYNANPTSMMAAIDNFELIEGGNKVAILGDMLELGEQSEVEHQNIVRRLIDSKIEKVILVGKEFEKACNQLGIRSEELGVNSQFSIFNSQFSTLNSQLSTLNSKLILLKGSNGIGLYKLIPYL